MDGHRFDDLVRSLSALRPRRALVRALAGLALGGAFAGVRLDEVAAKKRRRKKRRAPCVPEDAAATCAGGRCGPTPNNCGQSVDCGGCPSGETCAGTPGRCVCALAGPGEVCAAPADCCPGAEQSCDRGAGFCATIQPVCRYGLGGPCGGGCDCLGDLTCSGGTCACPGGADYLGSGRCCAPTLTRCGGVCCQPGRCATFPGGPRCL